MGRERLGWVGGQGVGIVRLCDDIEYWDRMVCFKRGMAGSVVLIIIIGEMNIYT